MNKKNFFLISLLALIFFILPVILGPKSLASLPQGKSCEDICPRSSLFYNTYTHANMRYEFNRPVCVDACRYAAQWLYVASVRTVFIDWAVRLNFTSDEIQGYVKEVKERRADECNNICPEESDYYRLYHKPGGSRSEDIKFDQSECISVCLNDIDGSVVTDVKSAFIQWAQNNGFSSGSFFEFPNPLEIKTVGELIEAIIKWLFWIALPLSVIFILYAAYLFITSGGKPEIIKKAKNTLIYTLIGVAIILLANSIPYLIKNILYGHSNTNNTNQTEQSGQIPGTHSEDEKINDCLDKCHNLEDNDTCLDDCLSSFGF